jgi:hypothetical protein
MSGLEVKKAHINFLLQNNLILIKIPTEKDIL